MSINIFRDKLQHAQLFGKPVLNHQLADPPGDCAGRVVLLRYAGDGQRPCRLVGTSSISLAPPQAAGLAHFAAPPLPIEPASLGFDVVFVHT